MITEQMTAEEFATMKKRAKRCDKLIKHCQATMEIGGAIHHVVLKNGEPICSCWKTTEKK